MTTEFNAPHNNTATVFLPTDEIQASIAFRQTVPREFAHKRHLENVYITKLDRLSKTEFLSGAYIPRANTHINAMRRHRNDVTMPVLEIGRQTGMAITHKFLGVDYKKAFILSDIKLDSLPAQSDIDWQSQDTLFTYMVFTNMAYTDNGELSKLGCYIDFYADNRRVFRQLSNFTIQTHSYYRKLRKLMRTRYERSKKHNSDPATAFDTGSTATLCTKCSVLADPIRVNEDKNIFIAILQVDRDNLFFFDHDNDHVPGMLLVEGMRQLAGEICIRTSLNREMQFPSLHIEFASFAELDTPVYLFATLTHDPENSNALETITIEAKQFEKVSARGVFYLR